MNENINPTKNPLELALEAFLNGTDKINQSNQEINNMFIIMQKQCDRLIEMENTSNDERNEIFKIFHENLIIYKSINEKSAQHFNQSLNDYQMKFLNSLSDLQNKEVNLSSNDISILNTIKQQIQKYIKHFYVIIIVIVLLLLTITISGYFSTKFYKTSVLTKIESRDEFLNQLKVNNQIIIDKNRLKALENDRKIVEIWMSSNPKDSESYKITRNAIVKSNPSNIFFKDISSEDVR